MNIETFVFFDLETTGLPSKENPAKITELSFLCVSRRDIERSDLKKLPPVSKLSLLFNPQKEIVPQVVRLTGLSKSILSNQPIFGDKIKCINSFLELPKPVCLVAHNGDRFDYKIIKSEYKNENTHLPVDLLCVDSLKAFKDIFENVNFHSESLNNRAASDRSNTEVDDSLWPDLDVTPEDWKEIDDLIESFSTLTPKAKIKKTKQKMSYTLANIYKTLLKKEPIGSHRAEADCVMLLECIIATKAHFLKWADNNCKLLSSI
ncbi:three-prime repair exonuclease 1-like [Melitaea cinxia]|uniref:three-prime repair exonuclease 1-like n=1 Tax=Melitaea cinxia TaxID=113334 RepID=UPI001E26EEC3|nr:three-prime repair exonuclease 1-like [Melitaea cinxia]